MNAMRNHPGHSHLKKVSHELHQLTLIVIETEIECHEFQQN
jgi:hypothetical protein